MPYKDLEKKRACQRKCDRKRRGYRGFLTHCTHGHEFTPENTYMIPGRKNSRACKICRLNRTTESQDRHRAEINARHQARRKAGLMSPSETYEGRRKKNLQQLGWTPASFAIALSEQEGKCAICKKSLTFGKKQASTQACADHEHSDIPKPRGILCTNCNLGIGNLQDDPEIMRAAIAYVEKYK